MKPVRTELVTIKKYEQLQNRLLIAIDGGTEFTKVLFLNKRNKKQLFNNKEASLGLELSVFHSPDFEYAINWLRDNAYIAEDKSYRVHVTGYCTIQQQNKIKSILKRDVLYIDEFLSMAMGCKFALEYIGVDNLLTKPIHVESYGVTDSEMMTRWVDTWKNKFASKKSQTDVMHPSLFFVHGSNSAFFYLDGKGSCEYFRSSNLKIQTLLGLSKCLANTNNAEEMIRLASKGDMFETTTKIKELIDGNINSPYGKFPPEMPIFSFGRCADYNFGLEILTKADVSIALVDYHLQNIIEFATDIVNSRIIPQVYVCGGLFQSDLFRKEFTTTMTNSLILLEASILDFDYSAILGALGFEGNCVASHDKITTINLY